MKRKDIFSSSTLCRESISKLLKQYTLKDICISRKIGYGNRTSVYLATFPDGLHYFALKVIPKVVALEDNNGKHAINEKNIQYSCDHPFISKIYKTYQDNSNLYMLLEFIQGGELFSRLVKYKRFPNDVAKFYAAELICALEYLHSKSIVYRDIKPENILLDNEGHIKIVDFGLAKKIGNQKTWSLCGTPDYMAPEMCLNKGHTKAVDFWALGVFLFELLAGFSPFFSHDGDYNRIKRIIKGDVLFPIFIRHKARDLIKQLLQVKPNNRLGMRKGWNAVKKHPWFNGVDWDEILKKKINPPLHSGSFISSFDTSNFKVSEENQFFDFQDSIEDDSLFKDF